jgi:tetratricopeptide (TPR) repeat protein
MVSERDIVRSWQKGAYRAVFDMSAHGLEVEPVNFFLLMTHGFSAYQLASAQINAQARNAYLQRALWALRKALLTDDGKNDPRIHYVLGQTYFYMGPDSANLCVEYLERARKGGYAGSDIPQFLGLAYARLHDYQKSVDCFKTALDEEEQAKHPPADSLLLAIARSQVALEKGADAAPYLTRAIETSRDYKIVAEARLMLAGILVGQGALNEAEAQINKVITDAGESADAHFALGELYNAKHDYYRARSEWRRAARIDPNYGKALERLKS